MKYEHIRITMISKDIHNIISFNVIFCDQPINFLNEIAYFFFVYPLYIIYKFNHVTQYNL